MKKTAYIIPGFKHSPKRKIYTDVKKEFSKNNFDVILVKIDWKYRTISQWVNQFINDYYKDDGSEKYLFGFSYGAMISFMLSTKMSFDAQILCSLSPYFNEDLPKIFKSWKNQIGKRRVEDFNKLKNEKLSPLIKTETFLLYGTKEGRFIEERTVDTFNNLNCKKHLIKVKGSKHDIGNKQYLNEIKKVIKNLN